jgi:hypothetical protein
MELAVCEEKYKYFFSKGGTNVVFMIVALMLYYEGGTSIVVVLALTSSGGYVGSNKVAASDYNLRNLFFTFLSQFFCYSPKLFFNCSF